MNGKEGWNDTCAHIFDLTPTGEQTSAHGSLTATWTECSKGLKYLPSLKKKQKNISNNFKRRVIYSHNLSPFLQKTIFKAQLSNFSVKIRLSRLLQEHHYYNYLQHTLLRSHTCLPSHRHDTDTKQINDSQNVGFTCVYKGHHEAEEHQEEESADAAAVDHAGCERMSVRRRAKEYPGKKKTASSGHFKTSNWPWERSRRRVQGSTGGGEVGSWGGERKGEGLGVHRTVWTVWTLWAHHRRAHPLQNPSWVWGVNTRQPLTSSWMGGGCVTKVSVGRVLCFCSWGKIWQQRNQQSEDGSAAGSFWVFWMCQFLHANKAKCKSTHYTDWPVLYLEFLKGVSSNLVLHFPKVWGLTRDR